MGCKKCGGVAGEDNLCPDCWLDREEEGKEEGEESNLVRFFLKPERSE